MIIDLLSIDSEGRSFQYTEASDELKGAFSDLIGDSSFNVELTVSPLGNTYQIKGIVSSSYSDCCSRCGYDIDVPLANKVNEIIVIEEERPRNTQVSQSQKSFDDGPQVTYINSSNFDLKEFLYEMLAAGFQEYPRCEDLKKCDDQKYVLVNEDLPKTKGHPGFAALENIKVKH